jgi:hypothetical protein
MRGEAHHSRPTAEGNAQENSTIALNNKAAPDLQSAQIVIQNTSH